MLKEETQRKRGMGPRSKEGNCKNKAKEQSIKDSKIEKRVVN